MICANALTNFHSSSDVFKESKSNFVSILLLQFVNLINIFAKSTKAETVLEIMEFNNIVKFGICFDTTVSEVLIIIIIVIIIIMSEYFYRIKVSGYK